MINSNTYTVVKSDANQKEKASWNEKKTIRIRRNPNGYRFVSIIYGF